ncbi:sensor histidine kinase [Chitinophaga cymbidii]|uniref:Histidine kinase n=1 Tax=Chitinophaga cymbidii TaxID=1096750 RepID=A0A512RID7_9BACT|nr:histidine kinase [Chitinophaga cymbidii]GEP95440.1 histidine kinase [Chitinophaga cymbidii]
MFKRLSKYWWCQILGWGAYAFLYFFFGFFFGILDLLWVKYVLSVVVLGILITHAFRAIIVKYKWIRMPFEKLAIYFFFGVLICSTIQSFLLTLLGTLFNDDQHNFYDIWGRSFLHQTVFLSLWAVIYFLWHYVEESRNSQMGNLQLEATVRTLELKTIKSQLNPHFIFNALNSIRALVDENPRRARTAITELSNILRSSMQADKAETVSLENELSIVKDYLALETIRFEERLKVEFDIDPETMELPVPPLMLQTLVENAIKHGISKEVKGGHILIGSQVRNMQHEITIRNTGQIVENLSGNGFGLISTRQRLGLLFGKRASFEIYNLDPATVEAKVQMPLL